MVPRLGPIEATGLPNKKPFHDALAVMTVAMPAQLPRLRGGYNRALLLQFRVTNSCSSPALTMLPDALTVAPVILQQCNAKHCNNAASLALNDAVEECDQDCARHILLDSNVCT